MDWAMKYFVVEVNGIGLVKRLYVGKHAGKAQQVVQDMRRSGWTEKFPRPGSVGIVKATTFHNAAQEVFTKQGLGSIG